MKLLDSNILIYAINESSPKHKKAQAVIEKNISLLCIAQQNIVESLRVLTHPTYIGHVSVHKGLEILQPIISVCTIIAPIRETYNIYAELIKKYGVTSNALFDAYLVATMISNSVDEIITDNSKDFRKYSEIAIVKPF